MMIQIVQVPETNQLKTGASSFKILQRKAGLQPKKVSHESVPTNGGVQPIQTQQRIINSPLSARSITTGLNSFNLLIL
jgi:hypothetical protein